MSKQIFKNIKKSGFTLIELLTVIAVIGLLSSIIIVSLKGQKQKAEMAKRIQFSANVRHALGAYMLGEWTFNDGLYPYFTGEKLAKDTSGFNRDAMVLGYMEKSNDSIDGKKSLIMDNGTMAAELLAGYLGSPIKSTGSITMETWYKPVSSSANNSIVFFQKDDSFYFNYNDNTSSWNFGVYRGAGSTDLCSIAGTVKPLIINEWNHVLGAYDSAKGEMKIYLNSDLIASNLSCGAGSIYQNNYVVEITKPVPMGPHHSLVDDIRIYDSPLAL